MISRNALYSFLESVITDAPDDSALKDAASFRSLRGSVDESTKVVRCDCFSGRFAKSPDPQCEEIDVDFVVEFYKTPEDAESLSSQDAAKDLSFEMAKQFYNALTTREGATLGGQVDITEGEEFDTDMASLGGVLRGTTYLYGTINPIKR